MKKTLLLFGLLFAINKTFAQVIKYGVIAGVNESTASDMPDVLLQEISVPGQKYPNSKLTGFHVGIFADYFINSKMSIQPELLYSTKGGIPLNVPENIYNSNSFGRKDVQRLNYLELPINLLYHISVGKGNIFVGGGPYAAIGISGKATSTITDQESNPKTSITVSNVKYGSDDDLKAVDLGLGAKFGFAFNKGPLVSINYEYGLTNLSYDNRFSGHNMVLSLSLGFCFK